MSDTASYGASTMEPGPLSPRSVILYVLFGLASLVGAGFAYFFLVWRRKQHMKKTQQLREAAAQPQTWAVYTAPNGQNLWYPVTTVIQPGGVPIQHIAGMPMPYPPPGAPIPNSVPMSMPYPPAGGDGHTGYVHVPQQQRGMYGLPDHSGAAAPGQASGGGGGAMVHEDMEVDPTIPWNDSISQLQDKEKAAGAGRLREKLSVDPTMPWNDVMIMPDEQQPSARLRSPVRAEIH
ncbi:hypothetical protein BDZ88DRAFT_442402 [Geranomyces variabilis]|nr:hypothetical protein BDZ88DRAFT_442402 [Geranomyces variabilis]KAJ3138957.1 hypothetical protein HDU90_000862 [Geranomyces variabilis]